jgi:hypothetical protein
MASINIAGNTSGTITLSAPEVAGSNTATLPAATGELSMLGGAGQTWQNMTASRAAGTIYTNNTGKPIMVNVLSVSGGSGQTSLTVGGVIISTGSVLGLAGGLFTISGIVPNNTTYSVSAAFSSWVELR